MPAVDIFVSGTQLSLRLRGLALVVFSLSCFSQNHFLSRGDFDPFVGVSRHASTEIYTNLFQCYTAYYSGPMEEWRAQVSSSSGGRMTCAASTSRAVPSVDSSGAPVQLLLPS